MMVTPNFQKMQLVQFAKKEAFLIICLVYGHIYINCKAIEAHSDHFL